MERTVHITITKIVRAWGHPALNGLTRAKQRRQLCKALLPDDFDHEKSTDAAALFLREQFTPRSILGCALIAAGTLLMVL